MLSVTHPADPVSLLRAEPVRPQPTRQRVPTRTVRHVASIVVAVAAPSAPGPPGSATATVTWAERVPLAW